MKRQVRKNPHGVDAKPIYAHENAQIIVLTLKPGESLRRHITLVDVFFYVLEGKGIVEIGDEKKGSRERFDCSQSSKDNSLLV